MVILNEAQDILTSHTTILYGNTTYYSVILENHFHILIFHFEQRYFLILGICYAAFEGKVQLEKELASIGKTTHTSTLNVFYLSSYIQELTSWHHSCLFCMAVQHSISLH